MANLSGYRPESGEQVDWHNQDQYLSLLTGLPSNLSLFSAKKTPISRLALDKKLTALTPQHRSLLEDIEGILQWGYLSPQIKHDLHNSLPISLIKQVLNTISDPALNQLVRDKLDFRTLVGALRHRYQKPSSPLSGDWTVSRFKQSIENNWQEPYFRLEHARPWLIEAKQLMDDDEPLLLEKLLLQVAWQHLSRSHPGLPVTSGGETFSFYAVVVYVLKWDIIERWSRYNAEQAGRRFQQLIDSSISGLPEDFHGEF